MFVALADFVARAQLLVILILNPQRFPDVLDDLLIRRRIVAAWGLIAAEVGLFEVGVEVAAGNAGHAPMLSQVVRELFMTGSRRCPAPVEIERRRRGRHNFLFSQRSSDPVKVWRASTRARLWGRPSAGSTLPLRAGRPGRTARARRFSLRDP